ncbi:hypothetical protein GM708_01255 [Vibrio cholerae]|nr:hypothetical protein [Vibrio cholerae]
MTSLEESLDPELLAVVVLYFGGVHPLWRDDEWLCYNAETDGIVISGKPGAVEVFFTVYQGDRSGGPDVVCTDPADALRYVLFQSGMTLRERYLYGRLLVPFSPTLARPGFVITRGKGLRASLTVQDAEDLLTDRRLEFKFAGEATEATFYLEASFLDLQYSIRAPSGEPLFDDVRQVQATSLERARP